MSAADSDQEREDLESLLTTPGWRRFDDHIRQELDHDLLDWVTKAADHPIDDVALRHIQQIAVYRRRMRQALSWPRERLQQLGAAPAASRQALHDAQAQHHLMQAGHPRRGGL